MGSSCQWEAVVSGEQLSVGAVVSGSSCQWEQLSVGAIVREEQLSVKAVVSGEKLSVGQLSVGAVAKGGNRLLIVKKIYCRKFN